MTNTMDKRGTKAVFMCKSALTPKAFQGTKCKMMESQFTNSLEFRIYSHHKEIEVFRVKECGLTKGIQRIKKEKSK